MSGYLELRSLGIVFRPFDGVKPPDGGNYSPFSAAWEDTCALLARELNFLYAEQIVVELDLQERDLRLDGLPRADARLTSDAVRLSFESKHGPVRIETAEFTGRYGRQGWQENVRAIALGLEALRRVDRYGISKRGEQYRGWRQITTGSATPEDAVVTATQAYEVLYRTLDWPQEKIMADLDRAVKAALRASHPDTQGGSADRFRLVMKAKEILGV